MKPRRIIAFCLSFIFLILCFQQGFVHAMEETSIAQNETIVAEMSQQTEESRTGADYIEKNTDLSSENTMQLEEELQTTSVLGDGVQLDNESQKETKEVSSTMKKENQKTTAKEKIQKKDKNEKKIVTFASNINGNANLKEPEKVGKDTYAPMNNLQILDNMEGAKAEITGVGSGVDLYEGKEQIKYISADTETDEYANSVDKSISQGNFWNNDSNDGYGLYNSMYKSMRGEKHYGGIAILFTSSSKDYVFGTYDGYNGYDWVYEEGWKSADRSLETTTMTVSVKYTNVGYYKGRLINAYATIKITPSKNRNSSAPWDNDNFSYRGNYQPMIQLSNCLYRGWVWQNVREFHVDLSFAYSDDEKQQKIKLVGAANQKNQNYNAMDATYYVINSLNPTIDTSSWETNPHYTGPEYILPTQDDGIANAYIVDRYDKNGEVYTSNIQTSYTVKNQTLYAYNGGTNVWDEKNDAIGADGFAENSVMIMPNACYSLSFTLGQLDREPSNEGYNNSKMHSSSMWSSISTTPFSTERQPIHIDYTKQWKGITTQERNKIHYLTVELYLEGTVVETGEKYQELLRTDTIKQVNGLWNGSFRSLPLLDYAEDENGAAIINKRYVIKETKIEMKDGTVIDLTANPNTYQTSYTYLDANGQEQQGNELSQTTLKDNTKGSDGSYNIKESFIIYNEAVKKGSIKIKKIDDAKQGINGVTFRLYRAKVNGEVWTEDTTKETSDATTENINGEDGVCQFTDLEEGKYLIKEIKTKQGYILLKNPIQVDLPYDLNGTRVYDLTYTVSNGQAFDLPQTGGNAQYRNYLKLGVAILIIASALLYYRRRRC